MRSRTDFFLIQIEEIYILTRLWSLFDNGDAGNSGASGEFSEMGSNNGDSDAVIEEMDKFTFLWVIYLQEVWNDPIDAFGLSDIRVLET